MAIAHTKILTRFCRNLFGAALLLIIASAYAPVVHAATVTPRLELNADPGQTIQDIFKITNEARQSKTYYITFENFHSEDESGNPSFGGPPEDLATWMTAPDSVTVGPGETKEISISIAVPASAEPGGHFAAIFLESSPPGQRKPGEVGILSKLGTLVLLRVNGNFTQTANILEFNTKDKQHFFTGLPVYFYFRFQNSGADHLKPVGDVLITNMFGHSTKILVANQTEGSVLPKSVRRFETVWASSFGPLEQGAHPDIASPSGPGFWNAVKYELHNFAFGKYTAKLKVVFGTKALQSANATVTFYVIPWQLLTVLIVAILTLLIIGRLFIRHYNRYIISTVSSSAPPRSKRIKK